jgi:hypothetical protein
LGKFSRFYSKMVRVFKAFFGSLQVTGHIDLIHSRKSANRIRISQTNRVLLTGMHLEQRRMFFRRLVLKLMITFRQKGVLLIFFLTHVIEFPFRAIPSNLIRQTRSCRRI